MFRLVLMLGLACAVCSCGKDRAKARDDGDAGVNSTPGECADGACQLKVPVEALYGVWGTSRRDWWAVGFGGAVVRGSGESWQFLDSPTEARLTAVWGAATDDVWIVGEQGTILHWDGTALESVSTGLDAVNYDAIGSFQDRVYALSDDRVDRQTLDGTGWETALVSERLLNPASLVECEGKAWLTGGGRVLVSDDGQEWEALGLVQGTQDVQDALVLAPDDVYLGVGKLLHWNGDVWSHRLAGSPPAIELERDFVGGVWALGADGILRQGDFDGWTEAHDFRFEWDYAPFPRAPLRWMRSERADELWFVGTSIAVGVDHWTPDGGRDRVGNASVTEASDVFWVSPTDAWAVEAGGTLHHFDGALWNEVAELPGAGSAVWASGPEDVWVGGRDGWLVHFDGTELTSHTPPLPSGEGWRWRDIHRTGDDMWFAAADIVRFRDGQWDTFPETEFGGGSARAMFAGEGDELWFFNGRSVVLRWDGSQWNRSDVDHGVHESYCVDGQLWGVQGEGAGVYRTTTGSWTEVVPTQQGINSANAWIGDATFGYGLQQVDVRRIVQFDGSEWQIIHDDSPVMQDVWGWMDGRGGIAVGTDGVVMLLGD